MDFINELDSEGFSEEELNDINECVSNLLSTIAGEQGLDRNFGIETREIMDVPTEEAENLITLEIIEKIDKYEPRVEVDDIEFEYNGEGKMIPKVYFKKREADDEED
nr:MAG TPA: baseplate assembly protein [Caudoviricetes sp.]